MKGLSASRAGLIHEIKAPLDAIEATVVVDRLDVVRR